MYDIIFEHNNFKIHINFIEETVENNSLGKKEVWVPALDQLLARFATLNQLSNV